MCSPSSSSLPHPDTHKSWGEDGIPFAALLVCVGGEEHKKRKRDGEGATLCKLLGRLKSEFNLEAQSGFQW